MTLSVARLKLAAWFFCLLVWDGVKRHPFLLALILAFLVGALFGGVVVVVK